MNPMKKRKATPKITTRQGKPREERRSAADGHQDQTLGYAQDAGHPGGLQDLRAKTDTETERDVWDRHG
jgi:hypothetical protein